MISAARHSINVSTVMRDEWLAFWQRAQEIYRAAIAEPDADKRQGIVEKLIGEKIKYGSDRLDFRDIHARLEGTARTAIEATSDVKP